MRSLTDLPVSAQQALRELEERVLALERRVAAAGSIDDRIRGEADAVRREMRAALVRPGWTPWQDVFGGPDAVSAAGIRLVAGSGGPIRGKTDAAGEWPLPTLIPFGVASDDKVNKFNLLGSLYVQGALMASKITCGELVSRLVRDVIYRTAVVFANSLAVETESPDYTFSIPIPDTGDGVHIAASGFMAANANLKTLKLYLGSDAFTLLANSANVADNRIFLGLSIMRTASLAIRMLGILTHGASDGVSPTVLHWGGVPNTLSAISAPFIVKLTLKGAATNDIILTSMHARPLFS